MGYIVSCESDMHCALTMVLLASASAHHFVEIEGDYTRELDEFCTYFKTIVRDRIV